MNNACCFQNALIEMKLFVRNGGVWTSTTVPRDVFVLQQQKYKKHFKRVVYNNYYLDCFVHNRIICRALKWLMIVEIQDAFNHTNVCDWRLIPKAIHTPIHGSGPYRSCGEGGPGQGCRLAEGAKWQRGKMFTDFWLVNYWAKW